MSALSQEVLVQIFGALHHGALPGFECLLTERSLSALERTRDEARVISIMHAYLSFFWSVKSLTSYRTHA